MPFLILLPNDGSNDGCGSITLGVNGARVFQKHWMKGVSCLVHMLKIS